jgi:hypothetical protein
MTYHAVIGQNRGNPTVMQCHPGQLLARDSTACIDLYKHFVNVEGVPVALMLSL